MEEENIAKMFEFLKGKNSSRIESGYLVSVLVR